MRFVKFSSKIVLSGKKSKQKQKVTEGTLKKTTRNNNNTFSFAIAHSKMNDEKSAVNSKLSQILQKSKILNPTFFALS